MKGLGFTGVWFVKRKGNWLEVRIDDDEAEKVLQALPTA